MWYKVFCSETFEKELKEIYKYITEELKSLVGWQAVRRNIYQAATAEGGPARYQHSRCIRIEKIDSIKRMTEDKYTVFYQVNYEKKEVYLLHLLYGKTKYIHLL